MKHGAVTQVCITDIVGLFVSEECGCLLKRGLAFGRTLSFYIQISECTHTPDDE